MAFAEDYTAFDRATSSNTSARQTNTSEFEARRSPPPQHFDICVNLSDPKNRTTPCEDVSRWAVFLARVVDMERIHTNGDGGSNWV